MNKMTNIIIDEDNGQIRLPIEVSEKLNLKNFDWLKVNIKAGHPVLILEKSEEDEDLLDALIHEGVLIDFK